MSREAMQIALDALEANLGNWAAKTKAVKALRQAMEEKQDPVAWTNSLDFDDDDQEIIPAKDKGKLGTGNCDIPLYTDHHSDHSDHHSDHSDREWKGLTDEEVSDVIDNVLEGSGWLDVARALEAAIKEKNQ